MSIADLLELERAASKELCRHASLVCARAEEHKSRAQIAHEIAEFKRDVGID